ncbi:MAG: hypothetical protein WD898_01210 [Candidatus Paceibacterota bacterium]
MTKLHFVHICEEAFFSEDKKLNVIGIFDEIIASRFPAGHPKFAVVTGISGEPGNYEEIIELLSPSGETVIKSTPKTINIARVGQRAHFAVQFINVVFKEAGKYRVVVNIDGKQVNDNDDFILINPATSV